MECGSKPSVGIGGVSEGAEPINAEELGVAGEKSGASGITRWVVGDSAGKGVGQSGRDGGGREKRSEGRVGSS